MANLNLERLANRGLSTSDFTIPNPPEFPDWFVRKFSLQEYQQQWKTWKDQTQKQIRSVLPAQPQ